MTIKETLQDCLAYPFRDNGRMVLIWGMILGIFFQLCSLVPVFGLIAMLILSAYFCAIFFDILVTSATGTDDCSGFPDLADLLEDLIFPYLKVAGVLIVSFLPAFLLDAVLPEVGFLVGSIFGIAYFPMAILAVAILGRFTAMGPQVVFPAIVIAGGKYWLVVGSLLVLFLLKMFVLSFLDNIFIIGSILTAFVDMLALMLNARFLGLLYREKEEELGWL